MKRPMSLLPWLLGTINVLLKIWLWYKTGSWAFAYWKKMDLPVSLVLEPLLDLLAGFLWHHSIRNYLYEALWLLAGFVWWFLIGRAVQLLVRPRAARN